MLGSLSLEFHCFYWSACFWIFDSSCVQSSIAWAINLKLRGLFSPPTGIRRSRFVLGKTGRWWVATLGLSVCSWICIILFCLFMDSFCWRHKAQHVYLFLQMVRVSQDGGRVAYLIYLITDIHFGNINTLFPYSNLVFSKFCVTSQHTSYQKNAGSKYND